jgi:hypothetical protein
VNTPLAGAIAALEFVLVGGVAAQFGANRATAYLVPTDVSDARALWVNPAGLAAKPEASVLLDLTVADPGAARQLGQASIGLNARGLSLGYQWDHIAPGSSGHSYSVGLGTSAGGLAAGFAVAFHGGAIRGTGWDLGLRYDWRRTLTLGAVVRNLGRPRVSGMGREEVTYVPAITARAFGTALACSGQARLTTTGARGYGLQASFEFPGRPALGIIARLDTDRSVRRTGFTLALSLGRRDRLGLTGSTPGDLSRLQSASVFGLSTRTPNH